VVSQTGKKKIKVTLIKVNRPLVNKVKKLIPTVIEAIKDHQSQNSESDVESNNASEESEKAALTQEVPKGRRILKIRGMKKGSPAKKPAATQSNRRKSNAMEIDSKPASKALKIPAIGKKRKRQDIQDEMNDDSENSETLMPRKQRKIIEGGEERIEKIRAERPKPVKKKPTVFKKNVWNPDIEVLDEDEEVYRLNSNNLISDCCLRCNSRNVMRAALLDKPELLQKMILDKKHVPQVNPT
jgi:hypothetical protein